MPVRHCRRDGRITMTASSYEPLEDARFSVGDVDVFAIAERANEILASMQADQRLARGQALVPDEPVRVTLAQVEAVIRALA